ncbi:NACHT domain-containing protein [Saccharothrix syringae]|uniref:NACHT domain-containing protein n=1 Tax=Saccharothrix syringae TaxID=103733 RepID=A0A5Q0H3N4_SACSY|nr:hypothetical protein [Saccharothrix syringae]QFZ20420.1 hypothetical protein EKG83_26055 [Saccharothrix syringae]
MLVLQDEDVLDVLDKLGSVIAAVLTLFTFVALFFSRRADSGSATSDQEAGLEQAADKLAELIKRRHEQEAQVRLVTPSNGLEVRFLSTDRPVAATADEVIGPPTTLTRSIPLDLHGDSADLIKTFDRLPARRLVILGGPGAGKTTAAVGLTIALINRRNPGEPVPMLVSLSAWNPEREGLESWLARRIAVEHPPFSKGGPHGPEAAKELVRRGMVLPVLDGFDEIATTARVRALRGIAATVGYDRPLVLTSRPEEYQAAIGEIGFPLGRALVVDLMEVTAEAVADYLDSGRPVGDARFAPVTAELRAHPDGVLAQALSTPLMADLARTAYAPVKTDPAQMLALTTVEGVERLLLDSYIPALYSPEENPEQVAAVLAFLAAAQASKPGTDLTWWRLCLLLPRPQVQVSAIKGAITGAVIAVLLFVATIFTTPASRSVSPGVLTISRVFTLIVLAILGCVVGLAIGALVGLVMRMLIGSDDDTRLVPLPKMMSRPTGAAIVRYVVGLLVGGPVVGYLVARDQPPGIMVGLGTLVVLLGLINIELVGRIPADDPGHPRDSLASDRAMAILNGAVTFFGMALLVLLAGLSADVSFIGSLSTALGMAALFTSLYPFSCAWIKYSLTCLLLWRYGGVPWRLMEFLERAHELGVLHRTGALYRFRHLRIQQYLAARYPCKGSRKIHLRRPHFR